MINNRVYDILKYQAQVILPALATLYFACSQIWGLPNGEEVVGTITAVDAFLGAVLGLSTRAYNNSDAKYDGVINVVTDEEGKKILPLELNDDEDLENKPSISFKVINNTK